MNDCLMGCDMVSSVWYLLVFAYSMVCCAVPFSFVFLTFGVFYVLSSPLFYDNMSLTKPKDAFCFFCCGAG